MEKNYFIKAIYHTSELVYWLNKPCWDVQITLKKLANHPPSTLYLQSLFVFFKPPAWFA